MAPGTGTPESGGMLARELLQAVRQVASQVDLAGMDVVEVSPLCDHAEVTAILAHRTVMEAITALAIRQQAPASGLRTRPADASSGPGDRGHAVSAVRSAHLSC